MKKKKRNLTSLILSLTVSEKKIKIYLMNACCSWYHTQLLDTEQRNVSTFE